MIYYALLVAGALALFAIFILQISSFAWIYFAVWVIQGSVPFALLIAFVFGVFTFLIVFVPLVFRKIKASGLRKNIKLTRYFVDNPISD
ncbi:MAG: hypothetical protein V1697_01415 [Candidatus Levyibacteriota bacterium]